MESRDEGRLILGFDDVEFVEVCALGISRRDVLDNLVARVQHESGAEAHLLSLRAHPQREVLLAVVRLDVEVVTVPDARVRPHKFAARLVDSRTRLSDSSTIGAHEKKVGVFWIIEGRPL